MKISLAVSEENYDTIREALLSRRIEIDDGAIPFRVKSVIPLRSR